jgi:hypothetical protein
MAKKKIDWDDKEQVLKEVAQFGYALNAVSERLRDDFDVVKVAIRESPDVFTFASQRLKSDKRFVEYAIKLSPANLQYVSDDLKNDEDIVFLAVDKDSSTFKFASEEKKKDLAFISKLFREAKSNSIVNILSYIPKELLDNKELALLAVKRSGIVLKYFTASIQDDPDVFDTALKSTKDAFQYGSKRLQNLYEDKMKTILIEIGNIKISIESSISEKDVEFFKNHLTLAVKYIKESSIPSFKRVLSSVYITLGTVSDIGKKYSSQEKSIAIYSSRTNSIGFFYDQKTHQPPFITLIHELGHQFHNTVIKSGFSNKAILELFEKATTSKRQCQLFSLPKIGDSLSDLREDWWSVKMGSENDYILTKIDRGVYYYVNRSGDDIIYTKEEIIQRIACPSEYGASNVAEFFAEMCVLITFNKVKPSQKLIADKFMQIVNEESL